MNKKGDIPVLILVIGVFSICTLAIISFFVSDSRASKDLLEIGMFEKFQIDLETFYFYKNAWDTPDEAARKIGARTDDEGNLVIEREGEFSSFRYIEDLDSG